MKISIVTPTFNEENNVVPLYEAVRDQIALIAQEFEGVSYEHIFIDNASVDQTVKKVLEICREDRNVKLIVNTRNFGQLCSPFHGLLQSDGDCALLLSADFQEPPELISVFVKKWQEGNKVVIGQKEQSEESWLMFSIRKLTYKIFVRLADIPVIKNFTGFGLYDKDIVEMFRLYKSPTPFIRGLVPLFGLDYCEVSFKQKKRRSGSSSNNLFTLYDFNMVGLTNFSKFPLRIIGFLGIILTILSVITITTLLILKVMVWNNISIEIISIIAIQLLMFSFLTLFLGLIGEYILNINDYMVNKPLVMEKFRINFD